MIVNLTVETLQLLLEIMGSVINAIQLLSVSL